MSNSKGFHSRIALTDKEFYKLACRFADAKDIGTAAKWWAAFNEIFVRELYFNKTVRLPNVGTFTLREVGESIQIQKGPDGEEKMYRVPAREVPVFTPQDVFIDDVNMTGVTRSYRKRLKLGNLSQRDYERQCRAEALNVDGKLPDKYVEASKDRFAEVLRAKTEKFKGKVEPEDDDE